MGASSFSHQYIITPINEDFDRKWGVFVGWAITSSYGYRVKRENGYLLLGSDQEMPLVLEHDLRKFADVRKIDI